MCVSGQLYKYFKQARGEQPAQPSFYQMEVRFLLFLPGRFPSISPFPRNDGNRTDVMIGQIQVQLVEGN